MNKTLLIFITAFTAYCSIQYELYISNTLGLLTSNYITWQTITIGTYIAGLGIGTHLYEKHQTNKINTFINVEFLLSIFGLLSVVVILSLRTYFKLLSYDLYGPNTMLEFIKNKQIYMYLFGSLCQLCTLSISILSGFEIPILIDIYKDEKSGTLGKVLGIHHFGTLIGTIAFSLFLVPYLDTTYTLLQTAGLNFLILLVLVLHYKRSTANFLKLGSIIIAALVFLKLTPVLKQYMLKSQYYLPLDMDQKLVSSSTSFWKKINKYPDVKIKKSAYQRMHMFEHTDNKSQKGFYLHLDYKFQFDTITEDSYHENFIHFPLMSSGIKPKKVLVLGAGDGLLAEELLKYDYIEEIVHVELDPLMYELAVNHPQFTKHNKRSLQDSRVKMKFMDALFYIKNTKDKFDAIFIDFPYPYTYNLARLYSFEFYTYVRKRLTSEGVIVLDIPLAPYLPSEYIFTKEEFKLNSTIISTFKYLNFREIFPFHAQGETFILLADHEVSYFETFDVDYPIKMNSLNQKVYKDHFTYNFPHKYSEELVNSIFKPSIIFSLPVDF
jgi:spermidine synthase